MTIRDLPALVSRWWPSVLAAFFLGGMVATAAGWIYSVESAVKGQAQTNQVLWNLQERMDKQEAANWSLLYWAREVSKRQGWPEPPTVIGMEKPAGVRTPPPPYRPGMYAAEMQPPKENP